MSILPESFKAYMFQTGIDRICEAYRASVGTMVKALANAKKAAADYESSGLDDSEYDEEGFLIHSTRHSLNHDEMETILATTVVREAFITSAFHYWERSARGWTGLHAPSDRFPALSKASGKLYPLSPQLCNLNRLNNLLKHSGDEKARSLAQVRPDYFAPLFPSKGNTSRHNLRLRLTHAHVEEAFDIVRSSGPAA